MSLSKIIVYKQPGETRRVSMDFANKMETGETISAISTITQSLEDGSVTTDLSFSGQTYAGKIAQFLVSGGVVPDRPDINYCDYKITVTVTTTDSQVLENDGILRVQED